MKCGPKEAAPHSVRHLYRYASLLTLPTRVTRKERKGPMNEREEGPYRSVEWGEWEERERNRAQSDDGNEERRARSLSSCRSVCRSSSSFMSFHSTTCRETRYTEPEERRAKVERGTRGKKWSVTAGD